MTLYGSLKLIPSDILSLTKPRLLTSPQKSPTEEPSLQIPEHFGGLLFKKTTASLHSFLPVFLCSFDDCPNIGWTFPVSYGIFPVCLVWPCLWCVCVFFTYEFRLVLPALWVPGDWNIWKYSGASNPWVVSPHPPILGFRHVWGSSFHTPKPIPSFRAHMKSNWRQFQAQPSRPRVLQTCLFPHILSWCFLSVFTRKIITGMLIDNLYPSLEQRTFFAFVKLCFHF